MLRGLLRTLLSRNYVRAFLCIFSMAACCAISVQAGPLPNPVPYVSIISPLRVAPGGQAFTVTVQGANFVSSSVVYWNATPLTTTYVSKGKLTASVPATLTATVGTGWITVQNPTPRGGKSNIAYLQVSNSGGTFNPVVFSYSAPGVGLNSAYFYGHVQGDVNGDGKVDLVGIDYYGYLWVFLGNGDGTFQAPVYYPDLYGAYAGAIGDVNGDGKLDIVVSESSNANSLAVHLGNGDGTFQAALPFGSGTSGDQLALADMNGDGFLDIVISDVSNHVLLYRGNGDGTFQSPTIIGTLDSNTFSVAVGDFNGDGILDVAAGNELTTTVALFIGAGDGTFAAAQNYVGVGQSWIAAAGDFNEDGALDFVGGANYSTPSTLILNNPQTGFQAASQLALGNSLQGIGVADLNGDGHLDIMDSPSAGVTIRFGAGDGTFAAPVSFNASTFYGETFTSGNYVAGGGLGFVVENYSTGGLDVFLPTVTVTPSPLGFGNVAINSTTPAQFLTITNNTPTTVNLTGTSISGTNSSEYAIASTTCGSILAAAASCTASITFTPSAAGARAATFNVADSAAGGTQTASLTGTGAVASAVSLTPASVAFQSVLLNTTTSAHVVTVKNTGDATLNIVSIVLGGTNAGDFAATPNCGATLTVNATCTISVTFTPSVAAARSATVTLTDDALDSPQTVALTGTGITDTVSLSATTFNFTARVNGTTSTADNVIVTNLGASALSIASIAITGTNSGDFAQTNNCGSSVASQANCTIGVTFTPTAVGARAATLTITDGSAKSPHTVALAGTGQDFTFAISAPQSVIAGASATFQLTITPEDNFAQSVSFSCTNSILHSTCAVSPTSVTPVCSNPATVMLTVTTSSGTTMPVMTFPRGRFPGTTLRLLTTFAAFAMLILIALRKTTAAQRYRCALLLLTAFVFTGIAVGVAACDSGSSTRTPAGSYTVTVTATSGGLSHSVSANLTVQ